MDQPNEPNDVPEDISETGGEDNIIRIFHRAGENRLYGYAAAATEIAFSISLDGVDYDLAVSKFCEVIPPLLRVDVALMELYDGNLDSNPNPADLGRIAVFRKWASKRDLDTLSDLLDPDGG